MNSKSSQKSKSPQKTPPKNPPKKPPRPITNKYLDSEIKKRKANKDYIAEDFILIDEEKKALFDNNDYDFTFDDISQILDSKPIILEGKESTKYIFFDKSTNLHNSEINNLNSEINIESGMFEETILYSDKDKETNKFSLIRADNGKVIRYYVYKCTNKTKEENLKPVEPDSINEKDTEKIYLISNCLHRFTVKLNSVKEVDYDYDGEEIFKLKRFSFKHKNPNNKPKIDDDDELSLFAYQDENKNWKWKKHNIYKIFEPQLGKIMEEKINGISFNTKSKTTKRLPHVLSREISSYLGGNRGGKSRKHSRKTRKVRK